jgi:hypothetical protein
VEASDKAQLTEAEIRTRFVTPALGTRTLTIGTLPRESGGTDASLHLVELGAESIKRKVAQQLTGASFRRGTPGCPTKRSGAALGGVMQPPPDMPRVRITYT